MSFVRPEALSALVRWREAFIGALVIALGLYWALAPGPVLRWVGIATMLIGGAILWEGIRRARLKWGHGGTGVVEITERQITYLAPGQDGGILSVDELTRVEIQTTAAGPAAPDLFWIFQSRDGYRLTIPGNAQGADKLMDALAALPGVNYEQAIEAAGSTKRDHFLIWQKDRKALH